MRILIIVLAFVLLGASPEERPVFATYWVTAGASGGGDGSSGNPWTLSEAFSNASAGDIVNVQSGTYTGTYTINVNGTSANPILFRGYDATANDIDPDLETGVSLGDITVQRPTAFFYGDSPDAGAMPLLSRSVGNNVTVLAINGDYIQFHNFQISGGRTGLRNTGNYNEIKNIGIWDQTDNSNPSNAPYWGSGFYNYGNNGIMKNIYVENSGAQGFSVQGNDNTIDNISVVCDNTANPTDYYFLFQVGIQNTATDLYVRRVGNLTHGGHGICWKTASECSDNDVNNFIVDNTQLEIQFPGVHDNYIRNGYVINRDGSWNRAGIRLGNGSYDCTIDNVYLKDCTVKFSDWNDGLAGDVNDSSDGFRFNQLTVDGGKYAVAFHYFGNNNYSSSADNNTFYNSTFYNTTYLFESSRANSNTQFINCVFDNIDNLDRDESSSPGYAVDATYTRSNFSNLGFTTPTGTNITTLAPQFVDAANGDFSVGANLSEIGNVTPFLAANNDLGSFQEASTPPADVTAPTITSITESDISETSVTVDINLDEGATLQLEYGLTTGYGSTTTLETRYLNFHRQTISGLTAGTLYYYRAIGQDESANAYTGSQQSVTTAGTNPNPPPGNDSLPSPDLSRRYGKKRLITIIR